MHIGLDRARATEPAGFTLAELLVGLALSAIVLGSLFSSLRSREREGMRHAATAEARDQLLAGVSIVAADLRSISAAGDDVLLPALQDAAIEFRSTFGVSVVCATPSPSRILLPGATAGGGQVQLTWLRHRLDAGVGVFILDEGDTTSFADDVWLMRTITTWGNLAGACNGTPFQPFTPASMPGLAVDLDAPIPVSVRAGAPVRFVERVRYAHYRSGDSKWYLGSCTSASMAVPCGTLQPVSGPYAPSDADPASGLSGFNFYYYDEYDVPTANRREVARIDVVARAEASLSRGGGGGGSAARDTVRVSINLRSR